jgi:iron complex outermembrane receptor protein
MKNICLQMNRKACLALIMALCMIFPALAQKVTVTGTVYDPEGEPAIGASVMVQNNAGVGAATDIDGIFHISAAPNSTLVVSYVGCQTQTIALNGRTNIEVHLVSDSQVLSEVVVIGYGQVKKADATGSVTAIKPDDMNKGLNTSAQDMMQGKIAGVNVVNNGGEPGGGSTIRIRGGSSLNASNDPLIVIDGLAMDNYGVQGMSNPLALVNPADIESFTILKDASATAIYGSRASNGVIIITTKKGTKGSAPKVSYNGNVSVSLANNKLDVLSGTEYTNLIGNLFGTDSAEYATLGYTNAAGQTINANTDWQDQIYRTAVSTDHNLTVAGGLKNMPYRVSFGYTNQQGILKTSSFERYTLSANVSPSLLQDHLKLNINAKGMYSNTSYAQTGAIGAATSMDPTKPVYGDNDIYANNFGGYYQYYTPVDRGDTEWIYGLNSLATANPVALLNSATDKGKSKVLIGNFEADYSIHGLEDLHLHVNGGMDLSTGKSNKHYQRWNSDNYYYGSDGWNTQDTYNLSLNMYAQYIKEINDNNRFDIMGGYEWQHFHKKTDYFYNGTYPSTSIEHAGEIYLPSENTLYKTENYLVSFFGRFNYSLYNRYLFTVTLRDDGSSRFSKGNRWGLFPSAAFAWKLKEESFLRDVNEVSNMKLRLGYGITGQQEGIGDYTYFASYTPNTTGAYYPVIGDGITYRPDAYNGDLTWEKTTTWNAGLDLGFFNDRLVANVDYYYRKTTDLINTVYVAAGSNFKNKVTSNIGSLHNQGVELGITVRPIAQRDLSWEIGVNATHNASKIDELTQGKTTSYKITHGGLAVGDSGSDGIMAYCVGQPVTAFYTYQQVYDANGLPIEGEFVDRDGNGVINSDDRYFYKKVDPDVTLGLTSKIIWKQWDFSFSLRANLGNYVYNAVEANSSNMSLSSLYSGNAWHNRATMGVEKNWQNVTTIDALSDYFIQNASFLKCDNITLGYSFNTLFGAPVSGRAYLTAQNVFTITKYKGLDPEINGGYDGNIYPRPFVGIVGVSLNF